MIFSASGMTFSASQSEPETAGAAVEPRISTVYVRELTAYLAELGRAPEAVLRGAGVSPARVADPDATVSRFDVHRVLAGAAAISPPDFALRLGHRMRPGHHGFLGHAMLCARTLAESLRTLERFARTRGIPASYRLLENESGGELVFDLTTSVGRLRRSYLEWALMIALAPSLQHGRPRKAGPARVLLDFPAPAHTQAYRELVPCEVRFAASRNAVCYSRAALDVALVNSNAEVLAFCERRCELMLADLDSGQGLASRVRNRLLEGPPPFPSATRTARSLHMSTRALRRRLEAEGTSFRELVRQVREQLARRYLRDGSLTVDEVSRLLGYSEPAAFSRAFKAWTRRSPSEFRAQGRD
jgi:AraC-like DNA-binding protein